jgi:predicted nucleic acid-binding protein
LRALFVDTSGWMALEDAADAEHDVAVAARDEWLEGGGFLLLTDYVVDETLTLLRMRLGLPAAEHWWEKIATSSRLSWEWIDPARAERARDWFFSWKDKGFSFTDCTSFVVMKEKRLKRALSTDRHFEQAGFEVVPAIKTPARRRR